MSFLAAVLVRVPEPLRSRLLAHHELLKFGIVGGTTFIVDNALWYSLKLTVLDTKPVTAKVVAITIATIVSYILNREWSFSTRGGRERHHEAALFFLISGFGVGINAVPLYASRYVLNLEVPHVSLWVQEVADFASGSIVGVLLAMFFRFWAFRRFVFPHENARPRRIVEVEDRTHLLTRLQDEAITAATTAGYTSSVVDDLIADRRAEATQLSAARGRRASARPTRHPRGGPAGTA